VAAAEAGTAQNRRADEATGKVEAADPVRATQPGEIAATTPAVMPKPEAAPRAEAEAAPIAAKSGGTLDANTNAKDVVVRATALDGVAACSITFEDGLSLAGNLPDDVQVGGLCAMAPSVLHRINRHTVDTKLGSLMSMTLHCRESQMSFFMKGSVCLTVLHDGGDLAFDTHHKLAEMANDLSRTYSQPETVHVDH
jgi:predicted regulator of Ras-like GTPase activity (Roadblock/LC7/MglB family)